VDIEEAAALIRSAIPTSGRLWADVGAGDGTFTRALVQLLGRDTRIYAVDRDVRGLASVGRWAARHGANVVPVRADFTRPLDLPGLGGARLDGMLLANALHFVRDADTVLAHLAALVGSGGRVVVVEYDRRRPSRWVPYPIATDQLPALAAAAGLSRPVVTATRASAFGGILYVAAMDRLD
jgi:ubiquinone/menaquinone biosynthesis C-methylase UbiE